METGLPSFPSASMSFCNSMVPVMYKQSKTWHVNSVEKETYSMFHLVQLDQKHTPFTIGLVLE